MAEGALSIKLRCASWQQLATIYKPDLSHGTMFLRRALADARLAAGDIEDVLLVGGMTRWPAVADVVDHVFRRKPSRGANPDAVVALGAAQYAGITVNVESMLSVTARELKTGRAASVTIRPSGGLSQREIIEIINRRRQEHAALDVPPEPVGGAVRVTTRDQVPSKPDDPDDAP